MAERALAKAGRPLAAMATRLRVRWPLLLGGLLAFGLLIQGARLFWTLVEPLGPVGEGAAAGAAILPPAARTTLFASVDPFFRDAAGGTPSAATVTSLNLTLFGTRMNEASGGGSAIIAGPDGVQKSIGVGEEVAPGVKLAGVAFDHVLLDRGGTREQLFLDQSGPVNPVSPDAARTVGAAGVVGAPPPPVAAPAPSVPAAVQQPATPVPPPAGGR